MKLRALLVVVCLGFVSTVHAQTPAYVPCGQTAASPSWGPFAIGVRVKLGVHRSVGGHKNWNEGMDPFAGHVTRVTELAGVDDTGCLGIRVAIDGGEFFWRARDTQILDGARISEPMLANDSRLDQCRDELEYGPVVVGAVVRLKRHRAYQGQDDWVSEMDAFVGQTARVTAIAGVDDSGCPGVHVDVDNGEWFWRLRDLNLDSLTPPH